MAEENGIKENPLKYTEAYHHGLVTGTKAGFWGGVGGAIAGALAGWMTPKKIVEKIGAALPANSNGTAAITDLKTALDSSAGKYVKTAAAVAGALAFATVASVVVGYVGKIVGTSKGADPVQDTDKSWVQTVGQTNQRIEQLAQQQQKLNDWMGKIQSEHDAKNAASQGAESVSR
jgi:hypothetical protein